jgi:hypothetical protein
VCKCVLPPGDNPTAVNKISIKYNMNFNENILNEKRVSEYRIIQPEKLSETTERWTGMTSYLL